MAAAARASRLSAAPEEVVQPTCAPARQSERKAEGEVACTREQAHGRGSCCWLLVLLVVVAVLLLLLVLLLLRGGGGGLLLLLMVVSGEGRVGMIRHRRCCCWYVVLLVELRVSPGSAGAGIAGAADGAGGTARRVVLLRGRRRGSVLAHDVAGGSLWVVDEGAQHGGGTSEVADCLCVAGVGERLTLSSACGEHHSSGERRRHLDAPALARSPLAGQARPRPRGRDTDGQPNTPHGAD